ncbi:MAG: hypothetical protein Q8S11_11620 [Daejeonella sp.]|uniref:hypothetical protein n=1 Tax=Daejeonella sp. TaxID=2805397 RepID=UPI002732FB0D|nr:hypothetical protein [Daejeonella sp.]MDP3468977.1 hypothetical protein [Daejeonella sp.]
MKNKGLRFTILLLIALGWIILMRNMTTPLNQSSILSFEFIGTAANAEIFLNNLETLGHTELMKLSIYLDFIFPLLYGAAFFYGSAWACGRLANDHPLNKFRILSNMAVIAVACDFLENLALLQLINSGPDDTYAGAAFIFAGIKFLLLTIILLHFLVTVIITAKEKQKAEPEL